MKLTGLSELMERSATVLFTLIKQGRSVPTQVLTYWARNLILFRSKHEQGVRYESHMFIEDMHLGIMPYTRAREQKLIEIEPASRDLERLIIYGITGSSYGTLNDAVCKFIRTAASALLLDGIAIYETVCTMDSTDNIISFRILPRDPDEVTKLFKRYYHYPVRHLSTPESAHLQVRTVANENMIVIGLPKELGSKWRIRKLTRRLNQVSKVVIPEFQLTALANNKGLGFDFDEFVKSRFLEVARITRRFGWNQRQQSDDNINEWYWFCRYLRQERAKAAIRKTIVECLNSILNKPPLKLGARISLRNVSTPEELGIISDKLYNGNFRFDEILEQMRHTSI